MHFVSKNIEDSDKFAQKIAKKLKNGDIVLLNGNLGAGKTTFAKSLCKYLGVKQLVTSPTFTIINEYDGVMPIYHMDMYRVQSLDEATMTGCIDIIRARNGVCLIEWPGIIESVLPTDCIRININKDINQRVYDVEGI